jgi:hypothetical protein
MSQRAMTDTRLLMAGFDWGTRRIERFHRLIAEFAQSRQQPGANSEQAYEFVRTLGREVGETVNGALMMAETARKMRG